MASKTLPGGSSSIAKSTFKTGNKTAGGTMPIYMKYAKSVTQNWLNPHARLKPSDLVKPAIDVAVDDYPMIIEFNNMPDNTSQTHSIVDIDQPLFQPSPTIVVFEEYNPFSEVHKKIFFRNKDAVARRIKIMKPDSPFFDVSAPRSMNGEPLKQSKIASGMEVYFALTFKPQEVRDYSFDLVCSTEREKFLVPIRAIGMRPKLTLPDEVDFGSCPIKSPSQRKISVQNIGTAVARFTMTTTNSEFTCPTQDIAIEPGATESLELNFTPATINPASGEIEVQFLKGVTCYISLSGVGKNADVSLSTPSLTLEPSYISLLSQRSLKIRNLSDAPITYSWKSFSSKEEEEAERDRLLLEINRMEELEMETLRQRVLDGAYGPLEAGTGGAFDGMGDDMEESFGGAASYSFDGGVMPFAAKADEAVLVRKYRNLRKALEKDSMQFVDDIFEISPIEGQVWANSELEITVVFRPDTAAQYNCLAYLDVSGRHDRLPLQLTGQGIGPHAALSFDVLDIGDVFISDEMFYEVSIKNKGDIPAQWTFMSSLTKFGNKFSFSPTEGELLPNQSQTITIRFESDILGEFAEHFRFALQGNEDMLICQIKGHVVGPNFHFDCNSIDFGTVSFDYLHSTTVRWVNTSKIPMVYSLRIPQDGTYLKREFNIEPARGTLAPRESVEVLIEFIPNTVKQYDYSLAVDVLGVGDMLLSVPITAHCIISTVKLELPAREIDFGDCFIRYPYEQILTLTNMSDQVYTKFEIPPQPKQTKSVATYETDPSIAVIEPSDSMGVRVRLVAQKLGPFKVPMLINVAGSTEPPIQAVLAFNTVGPKVTVDSTELRWGSIECLRDCTRILRITNEGLISASMRLFLKMARSCYRIDVHELVLEAKETYELEVIANLDDCVVNKDEIHIVVEEGDNLMVPLLAKGIGTTMYCQQEINVMDLGVQLTNVPFEKQIVLENKGRRPQQLKWHNRTLKLENAARAAKLKKTGKEVLPGQRLPKHLAPVDPIFTVQPEEITLRPRTATTFTFRGACNNPRDVSEIFVLESKVGKERYFKEIIETDARCRIVNPLLDFSRSAVDFVYTWQRGVDASIHKCDLVLTNASDITLSFVLKTEIPFNLSSWDATLKPGQKMDVVVEFDPEYRDDRQSHVVEKVLTINYRGHPQKDAIPLRGEVIFPNLKFDVSSSSGISFGCVLNDTLKTVRVRTSNSCKIDVNYEWLFLESAQSKQKSRAAGNTVPPNQVFDILPVRSLLQPGQHDDVEFSMYGTPNAKFHGTVVCVVEGGPEYSFTISGEASTVGYELSRSLIDFGKVVFTEKGDQDLEIINLGKVPFAYEIAAATVEGSMVLDIIPPAGRVAAGARGKVSVRVRPAIPARILEHIVVKVAHFDAVTIPCYCEGVFPTALVALPRFKKVPPLGSDGDASAAWESFHASAVQNLLHPDTDLLPPSSPPVPATGSTALLPVYEPPALPPLPPIDEEEALVEVASHGGRSIAGSHGTTKGLSHAALEIEMQRMAVCNELTRLIHDLRPSSPSAAERAASGGGSSNARPGSKSAKLARPLTTGTTGTRNTELATPRFGLQAMMYKSIDLAKVVSAQYLCDFGNVIAGQTRKKIFKITNASLVGQLNWLFEKSHLSASGFSIEPEKVTKMAENTTLDFTVKFFARLNQKIGPVVSKLPLISAGSPAIHIILAANVCIPEVDLSAAEVDFGRVLLGQSKKMYVRFANPTPVTTSWSVKRNNNSNNSRAEQRFTLEPAMGSIRPGKKMMVCVEFMPSDARKYHTEIVLKIENNKKNKALDLFGEGFGVPLKFEPPVVQLGPVLPFAAGDETVVTVHNSSDVDVEFFSLDFDAAHRAEEEILSRLDAYDDYGVLRTAVRAAGAPLPESIMEAYARLLKPPETADAADAEAKAADGNQPGDVNANEGDAAAAAADGHDGGAAAAAEPPALITPVLRSTAGPRDEKVHQDIVLFGPPISGVSTQAQAMAKKSQLPVRTFDEILQDVAETEGPEGFVARLCMKKATAAELQQHEEKEALLLQAAEQSKIDAAEAFKKEKKGKVKEIPEEVYQTAEVQAHKDYVASVEINPQSVARILTYRLSWEDAGEGCIYDGIYSRHVNPAVLLHAVQLALPNAILTHLKIDRSEEGYAAWLASLFAAKNYDLDRLKKSIETYRKLGKKGASRGKRRGTVAPPAAAAAAAAAVPPTPVSGSYSDFPEALPTGEEPWLNHVTGTVMELEANEFKSLEDAEKSLYLSQLLYQHSTQIRQIEEVLAKLAKVWSPESGVKPKPAADAEGASAEGTSSPAVDASAAPAAPDAGAASGGSADGASASAADALAIETAKERDESAPAEPPLVVYYAEYAQNVLSALEELTKGTYGLTEVSVEQKVAEADAAADAAADGEVAAEAKAATAESKPAEVQPATAAAATPAAAPADGEAAITSEGPAADGSGESADAAADDTPGSKPDYGGLYEVLLGGDESIEGVQLHVEAVLPPPKVPPKDKDAVPEPQLFQVFRKPHARPQRRPIRLFQILEAERELTEEEQAEKAAAEARAAEDAAAAAEAAAAAAKKKGGKAAPAAAAAAPAVAAPAETAEPDAAPPSYRWVIPAHGTVRFKVKFASLLEGRPEASMDFEVVGTHQKFTLPCRGVCELPRINADSRNVFMRRVKALNPAKPLPNRRFVIAENFHSFGPLSLYKKPEWRKAPPEGAAEDAVEVVRFRDIESTNMDVVRVTNTGPYRCTVDLGLLTPNTAADPATGARVTAPTTTTTTATAQDGAEVVVQVDSVDGVFVIDTPVVELEEGETKEVKIWALPRAVQEYSNTLVMCVHDNPEPVLFPLKCWGVQPQLEIEGPWSDALAQAEEALAANTDKKLAKDLEAKLAALKESLTIDFSRILTKKHDTREFTIRSTCMLPVDWEIDLGDFKDSQNITIEPLAGTIPINTTLPIRVTFTSPDPLMLRGKFALRYADHEGGLHAEPAADQPPRVVTTSFAAVAEAYEVQAVSLNSEGGEEGGSEIDFGLLRVGDYAVQKMKMGNRGKYKIGFNFQLTPFAESLVSIEPMEGTIDGGAPPVDIKVTFCSKTAEVSLKNNKDITVNVTEPLTGEVVEQFPLFISALTKYNKFRLQPSKGISFGALRFDAAAKTKSVELRNEGDFEVCYAVMGAQSETDELDTLDAAAFACYARATPAAMRAPELGEHYKERLSGGGGGGGADKGKAAAKKPPAKGKGGAAAAAVAAAADEASAALNPLVVDPDELPNVDLPADPLVVGAFTVTPRIALVQPGQAVTIDMSFDPSGCDTVKEKLRICVSGANPKETLTQIVKAFELTGESSVPALVTEDVYSIFEEQEIVHSLCESTGDKESEGGGKIERLPVGKVVYAEQEKMLAFGPVMCGQASGRGVVERVRISNPTKIDIKVKFKVLTPEQAAALSSGGDAAAAAAAAAAGGKDAKKDAKGKGKGGAAAAAAADDAQLGGPSVFTVQPELWEIPPHEHRYVHVYFNPTEIKSYRSVFRAFIDDEGVETSASAQISNAGKTLMFDLGGSGTLPCIGFEEPSNLTPEGNLLIDYGKVLVDRSVRKQLVIRNDGVMPATCIFDMMGDDDFVFPAKGTSLTVNPSQKETVNVTFAPKAVRGADGQCQSSIRVSVLNNIFDSYQIDLRGSAYKCDAVVNTRSPYDEDDDDGDHHQHAAAAAGDGDAAAGASLNDIVNFKDINLADGAGGQSTRTVTIASSSDQPLKFELSPAEGVPEVLKFSPKIGHLAPRGTREVAITFAADTAVKLSNAVVNCTLKRIRYPPAPELPQPPVEGSSAEEVERFEREQQAAIEKIEMERSLQGSWDDSMKSVRPATDEDRAAIAAAEQAWKEYNAKVEAEKAKGKKAKPVGPPPEKCLLELGPVDESDEDAVQNVYEIVPEPTYEEVAVDAVAAADATSSSCIRLMCNGVADVAKYSCQGNGENISFKPTFLFQSTVHKFTFTNESNLKMPIKWQFDNAKRRTTSRAASRAGTAASTLAPPQPEIPCPFFVEPEECVVGPNATQVFQLKFNPIDVDDFLYVLKGHTLTLPSAAADAEGTGNDSTALITAAFGNTGELGGSAVRMIVRGSAKRPICHFDIEETRDYMSRRPLNMKNENGLNSPIEVTDIKVVELESVGLKTRNTFRFHITNPTSNNYEFLWESMGDPSPFWRCVQSAGMMYAGKRIEIVFEYLPDEVSVAESFFKFRIPSVGLEQVFLFTGKVAEPKVLFSSSRIDFHSVMLGGEGSSETIYLENNEHLPFNFSFEKYSLLQLDGPQGPVLDIRPKEGSVAPHSRVPIHLHFQPQEEVVYNFNILCNVKRKPNKLSLNIKGEGYAVHPYVQLEQTDSGDNVAASMESITSTGGGRYMRLKPAPAMNFADFGAVQVLDTITKTLTVLNNGKFNFDYIWNIDNINSMISLTGGKMGGTLLKGEEIAYKLTFAPQRESSIDGSSLSLTVAGKYVYSIYPRGTGVKPALRFSTMHHDFGPCFTTSPGGSTVIEETVLHIVNHDPKSNIAVECVFQKTRALWAECAPTVIPPGGQLDVPIRFAPREVKDYAFVVPFVVNGTTKVNVNITGSGINARLELVNGSQRRVNFGIVNVGTENTKVVAIVNKSTRELPVQLMETGEYGSGALTDRCVTFTPSVEVVVPPRQTLPLQLQFNPRKRVSPFNEDLLVRYAGVTRKLLTVSGKAQGSEISLDSDSLPFGKVVLDSQKVKKLTLENTGDLTITFQWVESTFGQHFRISPLSGKILPGNEISFDVVFKPKFADEDIRQDNMMLIIPGMDPLKLTCTGACVPSPTENIKTIEFNSLARKAQEKTVKIDNPGEKDWFLSPSLQGDDWKVPHEVKVPAKGSAELAVTYYPLTMTNKPTPPAAAAASSVASSEGEQAKDAAHHGQLFIALPDGSALLYKLIGQAGPPESSGHLSVETPAKTPSTVILKVKNWLGETQRFDVTVDITEKPTPATFIVAANATEIGPNGTKEFPVRFVSFVEGNSKGTVTFTNPVTGEYVFFDLSARTGMPDVLETIAIESPVRQTARYIVTVENPLPADVDVSMGSIAKPGEWWSCDSPYIKVNELSQLSGNHEGTFEVEYRPLMPTAQPMEHLMTIITKELGTFKYKLVVKATPPLLKQILRFSAPLGVMQSESFIFHAYNTVKSTYACSVTKPNFFTVDSSLVVEPVINGWDGDDVRLNVMFEPTEIGDVADTLTVSSPEGGEYVCELIGSCIPPIPQGPYFLEQGKGPMEIPFRNCFPQSCSWSFSVDSPAFRVVAPTATVNAKSQSSCSVAFEPQEEHCKVDGAEITAKLFISCTSIPNIPSWVYYLRGKVNLYAANTTAKGGKKK